MITIEIEKAQNGYSMRILLPAADGGMKPKQEKLLIAENLDDLAELFKDWTREALK